TSRSDPLGLTHLVQPPSHKAPCMAGCFVVPDSIQSKKTSEKTVNDAAVAQMRRQNPDKIERC
ncbi:hypothetical protein, partial [Pontibacterium sp.]|uniref:hypothetical protein n=1 Tax=Pontibacterium sp. TaxID=2036026 RepID=UPI003515523B